MQAVTTLISTDPWTNLATEQYLFETLGADEHRLLIWRNSPCVVIGRHQNPWLECDLSRMARDGVPLVRRTSGGGAVYHDPGNVNFTFTGSESTYNLDRQFAVVLAALHGLGIPAGRNHRNDLVIPGEEGPRKFSGSAFRHTRGRSLHHGTLLLDADLERLTAYLAPPLLGITSRSIASVRATVVNLAELHPGLRFDKLAARLGGAYEREFGPAVHLAPPAAAGEDATIARHREELCSWEWRFGKTPAFTRELTLAAPAGEHRLVVTVRNGRIESVAPGTASPVLTDTLRGVRYAGNDIAERAADAPRELRGLLLALAEAVSHAPAALR